GRGGACERGAEEEGARELRDTRRGRHAWLLALGRGAEEVPGSTDARGSSLQLQKYNSSVSGPVLQGFGQAVTLRAWRFARRFHPPWMRVPSGHCIRMRCPNVRGGKFHRAGEGIREFWRRRAGIRPGTCGA